LRQRLGNAGAAIATSLMRSLPQRIGIAIWYHASSKRGTLVAPPIAAWNGVTIDDSHILRVV
jgi:hypothetical protein